MFPDNEGVDPKTIMLVVVIGILIGGVAIYFATTFLPSKKSGNTTPPKVNDETTPSQKKAPNDSEETEDSEEKTSNQSSLQLVSDDFSQNGIIPIENTCQSSKNTIPTLRIENVPVKTHTFAILLTKKSNSKVLWGAYDLPRDKVTLEGEKFIKGAKMIKTEFGTGYVGPCPNMEQKYAFTLYAIDDKADLPTDHPISPDKLKKAMEGHVIAKTALEASFAPAGPSEGY